MGTCGSQAAFLLTHTLTKQISLVLRVLQVMWVL
jgi:hypothetical protein